MILILMMMRRVMTLTGILEKMMIQIKQGTEKDKCAPNPPPSWKKMLYEKDSKLEICNFLPFKRIKLYFSPIWKYIQTQLLKFSWTCHSIIARHLSFSLNFLNFEYFSFVFETEIFNLWKINIQFMKHFACFINLNSTINPMYEKCRFQTFCYNFPFLIFVHRFTSSDWFLKDIINQSTILSLHNRKIHVGANTAFKTSPEQYFLLSFRIRKCGKKLETTAENQKELVKDGSWDEHDETYGVLGHRETDNERDPKMYEMRNI